MLAPLAVSLLREGGFESGDPPDWLIALVIVGPLTLGLALGGVLVATAGRRLLRR